MIGTGTIKVEFESTGDTDLDVIRMIGEALKQVSAEQAKVILTYWVNRLEADHE